MYLSDVLYILFDQARLHGFTHIEIFLRLFGNINISDNSYRIIYDDGCGDTLKNILKNKATIHSDLVTFLITPKGFQQFVSNIANNYLLYVNSRKTLYTMLMNLLNKISYLPKEHIYVLSHSFDYEISTDLAKYIAICILIGDYNYKFDKKQKKSDLPLEYGFSLDFCMPENISFQKQIWKASQKSYFESHKRGNRFYSLNIIERLLPKGYIENNSFQFRGKDSAGKLYTLIELLNNTTDDISVVGEGGIGKTTFLQKLLENTFGHINSEDRTFCFGGIIPIYIELNRCPSNINDWYIDEYHRTNFITRYIGQLLENHTTLSEVDECLLSKIEKEFQRVPENNTPQYLLLLDGFNEVSVARGTGNDSIRSTLSNEISMLHKYNNLRIITTSRVTQSAYYANDFLKINLLGLEDNDIFMFLKKKQYNHTQIGTIFSNKSLMKCLRIPLFLCMFCSNKSKELIMPETPGEILYNFFHKDSAFYNIRMRSIEANNNPLSELHTAIILDFILPYIGWYFEQKDIFSLSKKEFITQLTKSIYILKNLIECSDELPFAYYKYDTTILLAGIRSLITTIDHVESIVPIIQCIHDYLGIIYEYSTTTGQFSERIRYSFIHHHFRDYFSAMWDIQLLRLLQCIDVEKFNNYDKDSEYSYNYYLNLQYWHDHKATFISQILLEHHNKPVLINNNWILPKYQTDEQAVLSKGLDFCRKLTRQKTHLKFILQNIINAIYKGREELSGVDLSSLDLRYCNFFNIQCSKASSSSVLAACFDNCIISADAFEPIEHLDDIEEYKFTDNHCFTIDIAGIIKVWDTISGKQLFSLQDNMDNSFPDFSSAGFIALSKDNHWLARKVQQTDPESQGALVNIFNLNKPDEEPIHIFPYNRHNTITAMNFTEDSQFILFICDTKDLYCYQFTTNKLMYHARLDMLYKNSIIFTPKYDSHFYIFSAEYTTLDYTSYEDMIDDEEQGDLDYDDEDDNIPSPCFIAKFDTIKKDIKILHSFISSPNTTPSIDYFPMSDCFLYYNYENKQIELFNCTRNITNYVLSDILNDNFSEAPSAIHHSGKANNEGYIMYPDICYHIELANQNNATIIIKYEPPFIEDNPLYFAVNICPTSNRFLLKNDRHTYEWNIETEELPYKYNTATYSCCALIPDYQKQIFILVHSCNGISIFSSKSFKLIKSFCFVEQDYDIVSALYDQQHCNLILLFERENHDFIKILNIENGLAQIIYSTIDCTIEDICLSNDGQYILITTHNFCLEYHITTQNSYTVYQSGDNEIITRSSYNNNDICIGIAEKEYVSTKHFPPRCETYHRVISEHDYNYAFTEGYFLPTLTHELQSFFVHQNHDLGTECSKKENGIQSYWVTQGFFMQNTPDILNFLCVQTFTKAGNTIIESGIKQYHCFDMVQVIHSFAIDNIQKVGSTANTYSYLSENFTKAMFIQDYEIVTYWTNLKDSPESFKIFDYQNNPSFEGGRTYWDFAIPVNNTHFICCTENYRLFPVLATTGDFEEEIEYNPGVCISKCSFINITAPNSVLSLIRINGGIT